MESVWEFPFEIGGWLTLAEGTKLAEIAKGKRVLEIGSYLGRSTICIAQTAKSVNCIDPLDGSACHIPLRETGDDLVANLKRYGIRDKVRIHIGTTKECAPDLPDKSFDLVFIDGDHSAAAVDIDIREALRLLVPGGIIAFHDYRPQAYTHHGKANADAAVVAAVNHLLLDGSELENVTDSLAVVKPGIRAKLSKPVVLLVQPRRGNFTAAGSGEAFYLSPSFGACEVVRSWTKSSILDHGFNRLWAIGLNLRKRGITHLAMLHDDIQPAQGFLDVLLAEKHRTKADVISCVVPIKTAEGLTSTAVETADVWHPRRLTITETQALPETFTDEDVGGELLLNSGVWLCDLRASWVDNPEPMIFQTLNRIILDKDGEWQAQVRSEDWEFSRAARARGAKLVATRKVPLVHFGEADFPNDSVWGTWETDEIHKKPETALAS